MSTTPHGRFRNLSAFALSVALIAGIFVVASAPGLTSPASAAASLTTNQMLTTNQALVSPNTFFSAVMQGDGNVVVYQQTLMGRVAIWSTHTNGSGATHLVMQGDGNLVLYPGPPSQMSGAKWASGTHGSAPFTLQMQNDGNLVVYGADGPLWSSKTGPIASAPAPAPAPAPTPTPAPTPPPASDPGSCPGNQLCTYGTLREGQSLVNGSYTAALQADGNFVLYDGPQTASNAYWSTGTNNGFGVLRLVMQGDGNLVLYTPSNSAVWASHGSGSNAYTVLQGDGNLVTISNGRPVWASGGAPVSGSVGVYAYPSAAQAINDGWRQIGVTGALGSLGSPWVQSPNGSDRATGLAIQNSGRSINWNSYWTVSGPPGAACNGAATLGTYGVLNEGSSLSVGPFTLLMQGDGNLVLYNGSITAAHAMWATGTNNGRGVLHLTMQGDGNLVLYTASGTAVWSTGGQGANAVLSLQCDGNLVTYSGGRATWATGTSVPFTGTPQTFHDIGYTAGQQVAHWIDGYGLAIKPNFVTLDPEGYPDNHSGLDAAGSAQWAAMMQGWSDGIRSIDGSLTPAFYATQSEYLQFNLASINMPFFLAVAFGGDGNGIVPPRRLSGVNGANIRGVVAFYYGPSGAIQCATVRQAAANIASWGYPNNTLQFNPGLACHA